jgi:hypothetical protein
MQECNERDDVKRTMQEWSAPEINEYHAGMYTEGKSSASKEVTSGSGSKISYGQSS